MTDTRKQIVIALDRAAGRCDFGATSRQTWFLAGLLAERGSNAAGVGCDICNSNARLTKKQASLYIDQLLSEKKLAA